MFLYLSRTQSDNPTSVLTITLGEDMNMSEKKVFSKKTHSRINKYRMLLLSHIALGMWWMSHSLIYRLQINANNEWNVNKIDKKMVDKVKFPKVES